MLAALTSWGARRGVVRQIDDGRRFSVSGFRHVVGPFLRSGWRREHGPALRGGLEEEDRSRHRGVERGHASAHRDARRHVDAAADPGVETATLAADDDGQRPAHVDLADGQRGIAVGAHDAHAAGVQVDHAPGQVGQGHEQEVLDRTGRCLDGGRADGRRAVRREEDAMDTTGLGRAQERSHVLGILEMVEDEDAVAAPHGSWPGPGRRPAWPSGAGRRRAPRPGARRSH